MMKTDAQVQMDVQEQLQWEPSVTASDVGVTVSSGVVTLRGTVPTYAEKDAAEKAARRVDGVKGVAEDLQVKPAGAHKRSDTEIAQAAVSALQWHVWLPSGIQATVQDGWVTLRGQVNWDYQRQAAFEAVQYLAGVVGVSNDITIKPTVQPSAVRNAIEQALKRDAEIDAENVVVRADGGKVTLSGTVHSWTERDEADSAAWSAPGVSVVQNDLIVWS